jgi:hypothetical protein
MPLMACSSASGVAEDLVSGVMVVIRIGQNGTCFVDVFRCF